jgi:hypothetical protein
MGQLSQKGFITLSTFSRHKFELFRVNLQLSDHYKIYRPCHAQMAKLRAIGHICYQH